MRYDFCEQMVLVTFQGLDDQFLSDEYDLEILDLKGMCPTKFKKEPIYLHQSLFDGTDGQGVTACHVF